MRKFREYLPSPDNLIDLKTMSATVFHNNLVQNIVVNQYNFQFLECKYMYAISVQYKSLT